ncbi:1-acyl-sn-glycerol-3-phosphate acyltransferase [Erythrobacteraceae bacterium CFH 75059]|uniref:lysophospholipid acyltransferase family protein n=1 Tax=Qipengyuania thermophila TaxID=2509361 RepID=UPI00101FC369|nr:lysophospholipid acyltransferase family protein [Qipengyuania thermophila]TCD06410.1 1-acyl-sn-glycerol-3-phosphate acyltransferase [Erythrobacteraceae bacterium CFH 75059]
MVTVAAARSLLFYAVFYLGSAGYTSAALLARLRSDDAFRRVVRGWSLFHRWCVRVLIGSPIRVEGAPPPGPALFAVKHESFFEAIDAPALFDTPSVFAKQELFGIPLWGRAARAYGLIPVARDGGARTLMTMLREARAMVAAGRPLVLLPEGTRVPVGTAPPLQSGFAGLYKALGLPVVPVAVDSGRAYHRWIKRPVPITYRFGAPVPPGLPREEAEARVHAAINMLAPAAL